MIDLRTTSATLARFVHDLDAQAPDRLARSGPFRPRAGSALPCGTCGASTLAARAMAGARAELEGADPDDVSAAHLGWASRIVDEHRSVIVLSELLGLLAILRAPYETMAAVQRLIGDELRHVKLCAETAEMFGPLAALEIDLEDLALPPSDEDPAARALTIVARELVVAEGESILVLRAYRDACSDPACRAALSILLADEARHAATGRHLLERLVPALPERAIAPLLGTLPGLMRADAREIRAAHRRAASDGPGRRYGVSIRQDEAPASLSMSASADANVLSIPASAA